MLVAEAIGLGLKCLKVALVLLEFEMCAIFFSNASGFNRLKLVLDQLKVALFGAKDYVDAKLLGANGVKGRVSALRALGALGASDRETWRHRGRRLRSQHGVRYLIGFGLSSEITIRRMMRLIVSSVRGVMCTRTRGIFTHLPCWWEANGLA